MVDRSLRKNLKRSGGFSIDPSTGERPTSGYAVSDSGTESKGRVKSRAKTARRIQSYVGHHRQQLEPEGKFLGGWREHGKPSHDYLDVSEVYPHDTPGRIGATSKTYIHNQKAFYDVDADKDVNNPAFEDDPSAQGRRLARMSGKNTTSKLPDIRKVNDFFRTALDR